MSSQTEMWARIWTSIFTKQHDSDSDWVRENQNVFLSDNLLRYTHTCSCKRTLIKHLAVSVGECGKVQIKSSTFKQQPESS